MDAHVEWYNFILAIIGVISNGVIVWVTHARSEKDVTSLAVTVISLADSLYLLCGPCLSFLVSSSERFRVSCDGHELLTLFTHFSAAEASVLLMLMAIDRVVCITCVVCKSPEFHRRFFSIGGLTLSVLLFGLYCVGFYSFAFSNREDACGLLTDFSIVDLIIQFTLPGAAILVCLAIIVISFRRLDRPQIRPQLVSVQTLVFICSGAIFVIFSCPLYVFESWILMDRTNYSRSIHVLVVSLYNTQAAIKLFVYLCFVEEYRKDCVAMFKRCFMSLKRHTCVAGNAVVSGPVEMETT